MDILIFSKTIRTLNINLAKTSSQIFEIEFAESLASFANVSIVSLQATKKEVNKGVSLYPINQRKFIKYFIESLIEKNNLFKDHSKILLFYGYDYLIMNQLQWVSNKFGAQLISYTFDTHKAAIEHKKWTKRVIIDFYFHLGIKKLNSIDGIILFNYAAYEELQLKIPYIISKVGVNSEKVSSKIYKRNEKESFNIVYAGTLTTYNGINIIIESMKHLISKKINLEIYGDGPLKNYVIENSNKDQRIYYGGLLTKEEIDKKIQKADLLLNLRDTNHYVAKFAFPSKLMQYLSSGTPVLSTRVLEDADFANVAFVIDDFTPKKTSEMIKYIIDNPDEQQKRSIQAKDYIRKKFSWNNIGEDIYEFFLEVSDS